MRLKMRLFLVTAALLLLPNFSYSAPGVSEWVALPPMTVPKTEVVAVSIEHKIYVIGGLDNTGQAVRMVEVFDTNSEEWEIVDPLPIPLHQTDSTCGTYA